MDRDAALAWSLGIRETGVRRKVLEGWSNNSTGAEVLHGLESLPAAAPDRLFLLLAAIDRTADDPTWKRLEKRIADSAGVDITPEVVGKFMAQYAGRDIRGAWSYAQTLPEKHRKPAVVAVIRHWEGVGAPEAVEQLPGGAVKEAARQALKTDLNSDPVR